MTVSFAELIGDSRSHWLVTGVAGFIGSHLAETLLAHGQKVTGLDDLSTGLRSNIAEIGGAAKGPGRGEFRFIEGSIESSETCAEATRGTDIILHQAALGSIPRSIEDPLRTHLANATGMLNMLVAARDARIKRFVYASSSSVYGDDATLPKRENRTGLPLAPYATTKTTGEHYARNFADHYGLETVGLRYFNVFGPRQDPNGAYAAVIPKWIAQVTKGETVTIHGDGETSRDFCYVANVVQANIRAALNESYHSASSIFNIAYGERTSLNELHTRIVEIVGETGSLTVAPPRYGPARAGDVRHSQADISLARRVLQYSPTHDLIMGLRETIASFGTPS